MTADSYDDHIDQSVEICRYYKDQQFDIEKYLASRDPILDAESIDIIN